MTLLYRYTKRTTREHYEKYKQMAQEAHITLVNSYQGRFLGLSVVPCNQALSGEVGCDRCWHCKFLQDPYFNNVPLWRWDIVAQSFLALHGRSVSATLAETVCLYKHLAAYQIVGAEPVFEEAP